MTARHDDRDELIAAIDLRELWPTLVGPRGKTGWPCPSPHHAQTGRTPPVNVFDDGRRWRCHGCGAGGSVVDLLVLAENLSVGQAFERLRSLAGMPPAERPRQEAPRPRERSAAPSPSDVLAQFVEGRRWAPGSIELFGLTAVVDQRGRPRVRFPYRSGGELVWWQDRAVDSSDPKYLAPSGKRPVPFAVDLRAALEEARRLRHIVIVEGAADLIALAHTFGPEAMIALPGTTAIPPARVAQALEPMRGTDFSVIVGADADDAGDRLRTTLAAELVGRGFQVSLLRPPVQGWDLDDWRRALDADDDRFRAEVLEAVENPFDVNLGGAA